MNIQPTILIADRNPNVRKYLQREMINAGYQVRLAENSRELISWVHSQPPVSLIIVDPDLPDVEKKALFANIRKCSDVPVVVHSYGEQEAAEEGFWFVEKCANSIEWIKRIVQQILHPVNA